MIVINYDFVDGTEVSYVEGLKLKDNFTTNCLDFFSFDIDVEVEVKKKNGSFISKKFLLDNNMHTTKEIRKEHNIVKMLKANNFIWIFRKKI